MMYVYVTIFKHVRKKGKKTIQAQHCHYIEMKALTIFVEVEMSLAW